MRIPFQLGYFCVQVLLPLIKSGGESSNTVGSASKLQCYFHSPKENAVNLFLVISIQSITLAYNIWHDFHAQNFSYSSFANLCIENNHSKISGAKLQFFKLTNKQQGLEHPLSREPPIAITGQQTRKRESSNQSAPSETLDCAVACGETQWEKMHKNTYVHSSVSVLFPQNLI